MKSESGSAPAEFVLMLAPLLTLVQVLAVILAKGQLDAAALHQATELAKVCSLADADDAALARYSDAITPAWIEISDLDCSFFSGLARVSLKASVRGFNWINREVTWHAALEVGR